MVTARLRGLVAGIALAGALAACAPQVADEGSNLPATGPGVLYGVGGTINGLTATGLVLQNNGGDNDPVSANTTTFTFATKVAQGAAYAIAVLTQPTGLTCTVNSGNGTMGAGNVTNVSVVCSANAHTVGGSINGLTASGLVLQNVGGDDLAVAAGEGTFVFPTKHIQGWDYFVTVASQPSNEQCNVNNSTGTINGDITDIAVICDGPKYLVSGSINGLSASGLVLQNNGGDNLPVSALSSGFAFPTLMIFGRQYSVTVLAQPSGETCSVYNGSGNATADVQNVVLTCASQTYSIGGTVAGLAAAGLVLLDNGGDSLPVSSGATTFQFATQLASGSSYNVAVSSQPLGENCLVANGTGIAVGNVMNVAVTCSTLPVGSGTWAARAPMPTVGYGLGAAAVNGIVYAIGGGSNRLNTVEAYDPVGNAWSTKAPMPTGRGYLKAATVNGIIYAIGGICCGHRLNTVEAYDPLSDTWSTKAPMPTARDSPAVIALNGIIYAIGGGGDAYQSIFTVVEAYDPVGNTWSTKAPMPTARDGAAAAAANGIIYIIGGSNPSGGSLNTVEAYDPVSNTWTSKAAMPTARLGLDAAAVKGIIYALGGWNGLNTAEAYTPGANSWVTISSLPTARGYLATVEVNNVIYAVGGASQGTELGTNEAYTPP